MVLKGRGVLWQYYYFETHAPFYLGALTLQQLTSMLIVHPGSTLQPVFFDLLMSLSNGLFVRILTQCSREKYMRQTILAGLYHVQLKVLFCEKRNESYTPLRILCERLITRYEGISD